MTEKILMRDQTEVTDSRLGLLQEADPRNDDYKIKRADKSNIEWPVDVVLNQGVNGACVGFAMTHVMRAQGWQYDALNNDFAWALYTDAQKIDPWAGGEYAGARPEMSGTSLLAGAKVLHRAGYLDEYRWAATVSQVRSGLMAGPGVLGCMWRKSMDEVDDDNVVQVRGRRDGGHALAVTGVEGDMFVLVNSWGGTWGDEGRALISEDDLRRLLKDKVGKVVFPRAKPVSS